MNINDTLQYLNIGLPDDIARRKAWGDFEGAIRLIDLRLAQDNLCLLYTSDAADD